MSDSRLAVLLLLGMALLAGCGRAPLASALVDRDVVYAVAGEEQLRLDAYRLPSPGPHPGVITIHGGAWRAGDKSKDAALARKLVQAGFVCFAINYRLAPRHPFPAQIEDCEQAVRWVRAHAREYDVDPDRIAAWGESAGGQLALLLGVTGRVNAVVAYFSPADFRDSASWPLITRHYAKDFFGGSPSETSDLRAQASPAACVSPQCCPVLLVHGDRDHLVPVAQSRLMKAALDERGIENRLIIVPGAGHNLTHVPQQQVDQAYAESLQWLQAHLFR